MADTAKDVIVNKIAKNLEEHPEKVEGLQAVYLFDITGDDGGTITDNQISAPTLEAAKQGLWALEKADFVFEAVLENLEIKQRLFGEIERFCSEHTLMASSTSGLSPSDISSLMKAPERMLVMHFWNPPYLVPLVEVVAGASRSTALYYGGDLTTYVSESFGQLQTTDLSTRRPIEAQR